MSNSRDVFLERILTAPHLAQAVPRLQPEVLHRVIQHYGLEDCGALVALATPGQLERLFDLDLWRQAAPGRDEQFDADRFGTWLEVMVDASASNAAATLAAMPIDLIAAALMQHVRVFDNAAVAPYITLDGQEVSPTFSGDGARCEVGGYVVGAKRTGSWEAITAVLIALADAHGTYFNQLMRQCCRQSNSRPEVDGLDDLLTTNEQAMFDEALDRETRRDAQGYVTPAQARAFLQSSRRIDRRQSAMPPRDPVTNAYLRAIDREEPAEETPIEAVVALVDLLREAGVMPQRRRPLLEGSQAPARLVRIRTLLDFVHDHDADAYATRDAELAYLANVIAAGVTIQARSLTPEEASNAAMAVCNLGLENWPAHWQQDDLVRVFQVGWTVLHEDVCMYAADTLIGVLASIHSASAETQAALENLRLKLIKYSRAGSPWDARDDLDVLAILDTPAWAALLGLIDQLPTLHAALVATVTGATRQIDPAAFEFISDNAQIQTVRDFMQLLPSRL